MEESAGLAKEFVILDSNHPFTFWKNDSNGSQNENYDADDDEEPVLVQFPETEDTTPLRKNWIYQRYAEDPEERHQSTQNDYVNDHVAGQGVRKKYGKGESNLDELREPGELRSH